MDIKQIIVIVIIIIVLIYILLWLFSKSTQLTKMADGTIQQIVLASTLPNNKHSSNYTYSTWIYVNDWNYRFGEPKIILGRLDKDNNPCPSITLGAMENNLTVAVACYQTAKSKSMKTHQCTIRNVPLQKWVNLIVSLFGRTLDLYLDGKLVRTCVLPGVAKADPASNILITPNGGFNGWTTNFQYWPNASNPQQAFNIYRGGFGGSILGNIFNKFRIKISLLTDNKESSSVEI
jgi:hypothetical protein